MDNKALFYIYGIKEFYPEINCSTALSPIEWFNIIQTDFKDIYFPKQSNLITIDGYLGYAEKNCHGDVVLSIEPISNSYFHNSCEKIPMILANENAIDCSIDFYNEYKHKLNMICFDKAKYVYLNCWMIDFIKQIAKKHFDSTEEKNV